MRQSCHSWHYQAICLLLYTTILTVNCLDGPDRYDVCRQLQAKGSTLNRIILFFFHAKLYGFGGSWLFSQKLLTLLQFIWSDFYGLSWFFPFAAGAERARVSFGLVWLYPSDMAEQRVDLDCSSHWYYCCLYYSYFLPVFKHRLFWETFRPNNLLSLLASTTVNNKHCINCFNINLIV